MGWGGGWVSPFTFLLWSPKLPVAMEMLAATLSRDWLGQGVGGCSLHPPPQGLAVDWKDHGQGQCPNRPGGGGDGI